MFFVENSTSFFSACEYNEAEEIEVLHMKKKNMKLLVLAALFTALTTVATMVIQIPSPMSGYVNLGDTLVLLSAWVLGPFVGAAAGGIGSMLADIITGYAYYAPGTLIIKALMGLVAGLLFRAVSKKQGGRSVFAARLTGGLAAEIIMVVGYFGYAALILQNGISALASVPGNVIQGLVGLVAALALAQILTKAKALPEL